MVAHDTIDIREVTRRTGLGRKAISARMDPPAGGSIPDFPLPIGGGGSLGGSRVRWIPT